MGDGHSHGHDHDHSHEGHDPHADKSPDDPQPRARALQSLLIEKGLVSTEAIDQVVEAYEEQIGPLNGARVVARAWTDPEFKERLLEDANAAIDEFDFDVGIQHLEVVENTPETHNMVVCTLCSCYPWSMLGLPPTWYKSPAYRSRVVREPAEVLAEFDTDVGDKDIEIWDSSSEIRYMVLPERPGGTEGMDREELAELVGRNAMIGVEQVEAPT